MLDVLIGLILGAVAGAVFFGGLRWTVSRLPTAGRPLLLTSASFLVRTAVVVALLVTVGDGRLLRLLGGLGGILAARTVMVAVVRRRLAEVEESSWT